jgi:hypothetical protein
MKCVNAFQSPRICLHLLFVSIFFYVAPKLFDNETIIEIARSFIIYLNENFAGTSQRLVWSSSTNQRPALVTPGSNPASTMGRKAHRLKNFFFAVLYSTYQTTNSSPNGTSKTCKFCVRFALGWKETARTAGAVAHAASTRALADSGWCSLVLLLPTGERR